MIRRSLNISYLGFSAFHISLDTELGSWDKGDMTVSEEGGTFILNKVSEIGLPRDCADRQTRVNKTNAHPSQREKEEFDSF